MKHINKNNFDSGFSLLEILLVMGILSVLATVSIGIYIDFARSSELNSASKSIIADLKTTRSRSMTGESNMKWGINFVNDTNDYYEIFSTPTDYNDVAKTIDTTRYLQGAITFTTPATSSIILFSKISGAIAAQQEIVISSPTSGEKTITVTSQGNIF